MVFGFLFYSVGAVLVTNTEMQSCSVLAVVLVSILVMQVGSLCQKQKRPAQSGHLTLN